MPPTKDNTTPSSEPQLDGFGGMFSLLLLIAAVVLLGYAGARISGALGF